MYRPGGPSPATSPVVLSPEQETPRATRIEERLSRAGGVALSVPLEVGGVESSRREVMNGSRQFFHFTYRGEEILRDGCLKPRECHGMGGSKAAESSGVHFSSPPVIGDVAERRYRYDGAAYLESNTVAKKDGILGTDSPMRMAIVIPAAEILNGETANSMYASIYDGIDKDHDPGQEVDINRRDINDAVFYSQDGSSSEVPIVNSQLIVFDGYDLNDESNGLTAEEERAWADRPNRQPITRDVLFRQRFEPLGYEREWFDGHVTLASELQEAVSPLEAAPYSEDMGGWEDEHDYDEHWAMGAIQKMNSRRELPPGVLMRTARDFLADRFSSAASIEMNASTQGSSGLEALDDDTASVQGGERRQKTQRMNLILG